MGLKSWLFGSKGKNKKKKTGSASVSVTPTHTRQDLEAARQVDDQRQAAERLVQNVEDGLYTSVEETRQINHRVSDWAVQEALDKPHRKYR